MEILHFKISIIARRSQPSNSKRRSAHSGVDLQQLINHWPRLDSIMRRVSAGQDPVLCCLKPDGRRAGSDCTDLGIGLETTCFIKNFMFQLQFTFDIILHQFPGDSITVRKSYTLQSVPLNTSSTHLAPHVIITMLLAVFPMRKFTSLWLFCTYQFVLLSPFAFPIPLTPSALPNVGPLQFFCLFILFFRFHI